MQVPKLEATPETFKAYVMAQGVPEHWADDILAALWSIQAGSTGAADRNIVRLAFLMCPEAAQYLGFEQEQQTVANVRPVDPAITAGPGLAGKLSLWSR